MDEDRLLAIEGRLAALELICPMIASCLDKRSPAIRDHLLLTLDAVATGYDFPKRNPKAFRENFSACFDEVAFHLGRAP